MDKEEEILKKLDEQALLITEISDRVRRMERLGRFSFWAKVVIWALVLVLPLLFLGSIIDLFSSFLQGGEAAGAVMGLPSPEMIREAMELYKSGEFSQ